jgi:hypothetical protein
MNLPDRVAKSELDAAILGIEPGRVDAHDIARADRYVEIRENALEVVGANLAKTERGGRRANPEVALERLLDALMEPAGREARQKAAKAITISR